MEKALLEVDAALRPRQQDAADSSVKAGPERALASSEAARQALLVSGIDVFQSLFYL